MRAFEYALVVSLAVVAGCQQPDVGQACSLSFPVPGTVSADFLEFGSPDCEDTLICIQSPQPPASSTVRNNPYCSKACVSDSDCASGETGLRCRDVVLDDDFLASLDPAVKDKYLGDAQFAKYCASPLATP